ncbi:hypothetical protein [Sphingomonas sp.]|uniref:hypothetical protein n=1 Tax=Sphingomonas sp. TaxID=28214 RepID=UPI00286C5A46|nr:hypothetical protein [Sphingomonas sp.]
MTLEKILIGLAVGLCAGQAAAENWVTVFDDAENEMWAAVDKDSIRRGADGLVYYTSDTGGKGDRAADCNNRILYTLKLYVMNGIDYPNWRSDGRAAVAGSIGEAELQYACANA